MVNILIFLTLLSSFFIPDAYAAKGSALPSGKFSELKNMGIARVSSVVDARTLTLDDGRIIRLSGIDIPDLDYQNSGAFAEVAVRVLRDMAQGQSVIIWQTANKDTGRINRMGQHLAHIQMQGDKSWVQGTLLGLGLARVRTWQRTPEMATQMYGLESLARMQSLGIWDAGSEYAVLTPEESEEHLRSFEIIEGTIISTTIKSNRIYLNFGADWRTDFTVTIPPKAKRLFTKRGIDPLQWGGKRVQVRGWVDQYNGAFIELNHPEAIILLGEVR